MNREMAQVAQASNHFARTGAVQRPATTREDARVRFGDEELPGLQPQ